MTAPHDTATSVESGGGLAGPTAPVESPARAQLRRDAEWLAALYPVRRPPVAAPWHPTCIHVPASVRALADGLETYGV
jgi:hypothetical protein